MRHDEFMKLILSSSIEGWVHAGEHPNNADITVVVHRSDLNVRLEFGRVHGDDFRADWANRFPDPKAITRYVDMYYGASFVDDEILVRVDGGRVALPRPAPITGAVSPRAEQLARLATRFTCGAYDYDEYFERAGLKRSD